MDLGFLDKSSGVTPLLVSLYDNHKLYLLAQDRTPAARAQLTNAVSELLERQLSPRESELIADVLIALIRQTERELRQALAEKLSLIETVPLRVILNLANDEIDVAAPVLKNSPILTDMDLIYIIKSKGQETWPLIASRKTLSDQLIDTLSGTRDFETALSLVKNKNITLTETALHVLSDVAQGKPDLAEPLAVRNEIPVEIAEKLYRYVGEEIKKYIATHYNINDAVLGQATEEVILDFVDIIERPETENFMPSEKAKHMARWLKDAGQLSASYMLGLLKNGHIVSFVACFAAYSDIEVKHVMPMIEQKGGQSLAIACRAGRISKADFISFYLLTSRVRNKDGVMSDVEEISKTISHYDRISIEAAQQLIGRFKGAQIH